MDDSEISNQNNVNGLVAAAQRSPSMILGVTPGAAVGGGTAVIPEPLTN